MSRERGQASIELLAVLPLLLVAILAIAELLAAGICRELAGHAAQAGATAILQGEDPARAARASLPEWSRGRLRVRVAGRTVRVELRPPLALALPALPLRAIAEADAGPHA